MSTSGEMSYPEALSAAMELANRLQRIGSRPSLIRLMNVSSPRSTTEKLHRDAGLVINALQHQQPGADILKLLDAIGGDLQLCATLGVLSSDELETYLQELDKLYELIDKEKA